MISRREFIACLGGTVAWPLGARAQQPAMPVMGWMSGRSPEDSAHLLDAFFRGLGEAGFVEGQNVVVEYRWARGEYGLLPALAADLVSRRVTLLVAVGGDVSAIAAKQATSAIPIVFGMGGDPIKAGLVASFNRPGGNATGYTLLTAEMESKRVSLLNDLLPGMRHLGALLNPNFPPATRQLQGGIYAGRILKGAKPADLPILQPTKFELVINVKTAKALGLALPNSIQLLADEVIE